MRLSLIIPVYNRPREIKELLNSLSLQTDNNFETIVVDDGSYENERCDEIVSSFYNKLNIKYFYKQNSGAGMSRNFGARKSPGDYYIFLDSDCILPKDYIQNVVEFLSKNYVDCFGAPDKSNDDFSDLQKAINYSMTSFLTTGNIRGNNSKNYQPRSFNMGFSKQVFDKTNGFSDMRVSEDIDLSIRIKNKGFTIGFIKKAFVYHKRRNSISAFAKQIFNFGKGRPILSKKHNQKIKITFWIPLLFVMFFVFSIILIIENIYTPIFIITIYLCAIFVDSLLKNKNLKVAFLSITTTIVQFFCYGLGFAKSYLNTHFNS